MAPSWPRRGPVVNLAVVAGEPHPIHALGDAGTARRPGPAGCRCSVADSFVVDETMTKAAVYTCDCCVDPGRSGRGLQSVGRHGGVGERN